MPERKSYMNKLDLPKHSIRLALQLFCLLAAILVVLRYFNILGGVRFWFAAIVLTLIAVVAYGLREHLRWPSWTGFGEYSPPEENKGPYQRSKTLWDWMQLIGIPLTLLLATTSINHEQQDTTLRVAANQQAETTLMTAEKHLSDMLLTSKLAQSAPGDEIRIVARSEAFNALRQLDPERKRYMLDYLYDANLIQSNQPIVNMRDADLSNADLSHLDLQRVNLKGANLSGANLSNDQLQNANLEQTSLDNANLSNDNMEKDDFTGASLRNANLDHTDLYQSVDVQPELPQAGSLSGAKLPDGTLHP